MKLAFAAVALLYSLVALAKEPTVDSADMTVDSAAALGSFEAEVAQVEVRLTALRYATARAVLNHEVTRAQGVVVAEDSDHVRLLLTQARAACSQSPQTNRCTSTQSYVKAEHLLNQAGSELTQLVLSPLFCQPGEHIAQCDARRKQGAHAP